MKPMESCDRCGDVLFQGDDIYKTPTGNFCPDCMGWIESHLWLQHVGEQVDRA